MHTDERSNPIFRIIHSKAGWLVPTALVVLFVAVSSYIIVGAVGASEPRELTTDEIVTAARTQASEPQQAALTDGVVAVEEFRSAAQNALSCALEQGLDAEMNGNSGTDITLSAETLEQIEADAETLLACRATYVDQVEKVWQAQNRPSARQSVEARQWLGRCMQEKGVTGIRFPVADGQPFEWVLSEDEEVKIAAFTCGQTYNDAYGFFPF